MPLLLGCYSENNWIPRDLFPGIDYYKLLFMNEFSTIFFHISCFDMYIMLVTLRHFRSLAFLWHIFAISVASLSTILYVILQFLCKLLSYASSSWIYTTSIKGFSTTVQNIQIRCSQILYWPIFLQDKGLR